MIAEFFRHYDSWCYLGGLSSFDNTVPVLLCAACRQRRGKNWLPGILTVNLRKKRRCVLRGLSAPAEVMASRSPGAGADLVPRFANASTAWKCQRRFIKADIALHPGRKPKDNPRFIVTNLTTTPKFIYQKVYCLIQRNGAFIRRPYLQEHLFDLGIPLARYQDFIEQKAVAQCSPVCKSSTRLQNHDHSAFTPMAPIIRVDAKILLA